MKRTRLFHATAFFLALGIIGPVEATQDKPEKQQEKAKPEKQEQQAKPEKQQQATVPKQEQQAKAPKQEQPAKPARQQEQTAAQPSQQRKSAEKQQATSSSVKRQQAATAQQEQTAKPERQQQANSRQQPQHQQQNENSRPPQRTEQATARQRAQPALRLSERGRGGRIPDERFRSNFGREHHFRIGEPVLVGGYSRFQYGGFWFGFVEPWPEGWYYTDDVYIDYEDGEYYMYDPYYPGARFSISVVI